MVPYFQKRILGVQGRIMRVWEYDQSTIYEFINVMMKLAILYNEYALITF